MPGIDALELYLHSWEVWVFFGILLTTLCTLPSQSTRVYTPIVLKVGGGILLSLFLVRHAIDTDFDFVASMRNTGSRNPDFEMWLESGRRHLIGIFQKLVLLLFAIIWGAHYLSRPLRSSESET